MVRFSLWKAAKLLLFNVTVAIADSANDAIIVDHLATLTLNNTLVYGGIDGAYSDPYSSSVVSDTSYFATGILEDNGALGTDSRDS